MKPAPIAATLLLHVAAVGAVLALSSPKSTLPASILSVGLSTPAPAKVDTSSESGQRAPARTDVASANTSLPVGPANPGSTGDASRQASPDSGSLTASASTASPGAGAHVGASIPASYSATNRKPTYPLLSRRMEEQGTVWLRVLVNSDGKAGEVRISKTSGYALLDESALEAVRYWQFKPASINGHPIAEWYQIAIPFKLQH